MALKYESHRHRQGMAHLHPCISEGYICKICILRTHAHIKQRMQACVRKYI